MVMLEEVVETTETWRLSISAGAVVVFTYDIMLVVVPVVRLYANKFRVYRKF